MAPPDALEILFFVLAVLGGGYLLWSRRSRAAAPAPPIEPARTPDAAPVEKGRLRNRAAETLPPMLRPHSEIPPKMAAKKEAMERASGRPPTGSGRPPSEKPRAGETPAQETVKVSASVKPATPAPPSVKPPPPTKSVSPKPAAGETGAQVGLASESRVPVASLNAAKPAVEAAKPAVEAAKPVAEATKPAANAAKPAAAKKAADAAKPAAKTKAAGEVGSVPSVVDETEDVEPTRVGRAQRSAPIRPLVEKIVFDEGADAPATPSSEALRIYAVGQTDTGKRRKQNQDSYLIFESESLFVVADGMGGHQGGEVASKLAVDTLQAAFAQKNFEAAAHDDIAVEASELARAAQMANTEIFNAAKANPKLEGMGTTLVAARFSKDGQRLYIAHVGDSRCYRVRDGAMRQMTSDHTMADYGVTGPEGAHLSRALGVWQTVPIDVVMASPQIGDLYLICSDGLSKMVAEQTIATQLLHEEDPKAAVSRLVFFANAHGGKDNVTVVLLRVVPPGYKPPNPSLPPPKM